MRQKFPNPDQHPQVGPQLRSVHTPRLIVKQLSRRLSVSKEVYSHKTSLAVSWLGKSLVARCNVSRIRTTSHVLVSVSISRDVAWVMLGAGYVTHGPELRLRISQLTFAVRYGHLLSSELGPGGINDTPSQREGRQTDFD